MSLSMYQASVPVFARGLHQSQERPGQGPGALRRQEDRRRPYSSTPASSRTCWPSRAQIHIATDFARGTVARLSGVEPPKWEDNETTFAQLIARVDNAIAAVNSFTAAQIDGSEARPVTRPVRGEPKTFSGINYLLQYSMPNFYFHSTTAYAILRSNGVEVGKGDFIGALD